MSISIYQYTDYRTFLQDAAADKLGHRRGVIASLARWAGCQVAYVSQVLKNKTNFSLEQVDRIAKEFGLPEEERAFLFDLVNHARAGSASLKRFYAARIQQIASEKAVLKNRILPYQSLGAEFQQVYYSTWHYAAVHVLVSITNTQTLAAISKRLSIPLALTKKVCDFLCKCGLIEEKNSRFSPRQKRIHIGSDSIELQQHHRNWRLRAMESVGLLDPANLHYSSVVSINSDDARAIHEILLRSIEKVRKNVADSENEDEIFGLNIDFFQV